MKTPLQLANEALNEALIYKKQSQDLINNLGLAVLESLRPTLEELVENTKLSKKELLGVISDIKVSIPKIDIPKSSVDVKIPQIKIPEPKVTVNVPKIEAPVIPEIKVPQIKIPRPEITINPKFNVPDIKMPEEMDVRGWINIMGYDKGLLSNPLPVQLRDSDGKPVSLGGITQIMGGGGGKADYFTIKGFAQSAFAEITNSDGQVKVAGVFTSAAPASTYVIAGNSEGLPYNYDNPVPVTITSGASATSASNVVDSSGIPYTGSNPFPITGNVNVNGTTNSTISVGVTLHDDADIGSAPQKIGGVAVTANPNAVSGGDMVNFRADDLGRQLIRPVQVRDLITTAYVSLTSGSAFGTETTLLAASAGKMFDLIYIMGSNNSDAAVSVDIRGITAGNVLMSFIIPAGGTAGIATPVPLPQTSSDTGNAWTVDLPDITGTNVNITALFSQEI
jgi:hypothetical protein